MIKFKNSILLAVTSIVLLIATSCETTELDLLDSPNTLSPTQGSVDLFLNSIQLGFGGFLEQVTEEAAEVVRLKHMFGPTYQTAYAPTTFDAHWDVYRGGYVFQGDFRGVLADVKAMIPLAENQELFIHSGIAKVIEAYVMVTLVDNFADVPYSEALDASILNPNVDSGADIYAAMFARIDEAIEDFNKTSLAAPSNDLFYGGNTGQWIRFANSLKLKMYLTTGLVNGGAAASINALVAADNLISDAGDDMEFPWATNILSPDSRHPNYSVNYDNASSSNDYMSNYLMRSVIFEKTFPDPRARYYFYRQVSSNTSDVNEQFCIAAPTPGHYAATDPFCNPNHPADSRGYWGRDHGQAAGIPPDGFLKTTFGLYPVGGQYDADQAEPVAQSMGGAGAGISPIILTSYVHFMRAAAALELGTSDNARTQLEAGIRASMSKVTNFISSVDRAGFDAADAADIETYVTQTLTGVNGYDSASAAGKLEIVIKEYYLALFGNGMEAFNNYRRTGYPSNLQPAILAAPGPFIRSFIYPSRFVNVNSVVSQKPDNSTRVFWDTFAGTLK